MYCQSLLLYTNFKFRHHWKNSPWRFSELSIASSNSDFIKKLLSSAQMFMLLHEAQAFSNSPKNQWKILLDSSTGSYQSSPDNIHAFSCIFFDLPKKPKLLWPKKKKKKKSHIYPQRSSCLNCTLKILIPKSLEWHQNKIYEISIKALSSLVVDSLPGVWVQILCRIKDWIHISCIINQCHDHTRKETLAGLQVFLL